MRFLTLLLLTCVPLLLHAGEDPLPTLEAFRDGKEVRVGYFDVIIDPDTAQVFLEVPTDRGQFILQTGLARGLGSNDIGLDRGQLGDTKLVSFSRVGRKSLLIEENTDYRAVTDNAAEALAAEEAFARSTIWGFRVVAADNDGYVIDYTDYLVSDSYHIRANLKRQDQGDFSVDATRSAPYLSMIRSFVDNTELEGMVTLTGTGAGDHLRSVAPDNSAITVHVHHSLVRLPPPGYTARAFHPESGYFPFNYADYSSPVETDLVQRFIYRHRLQKQDPSVAMSPPVEPIIYYVDPGVPEPVRSALLEGASWWNQAFEAAGFTDAFQVRMLPDDADPMDVRFNVIQWVHRSTRGWSYGSSVADPRTGEIIKGKVTLGSLRIRQDILIAQGLLSPYVEGADPENAAAVLKAVALARIRQLSAHEVGHTLGLLHNYSASTYDRGSVMDYPHPLLKLSGGAIDLSDAYDTDIGEWDKHAIVYGYKVVADERAFLARHIGSGREQGLAIISDADARPDGGAHPSAHLWDSGADIVEELENTLKVRRVALANMGVASLPPGTPYSQLEEVLVPIYYLHRYQVEAVAKLVGGVDYRYAIKGDDDFDGVVATPAQVQQRALGALFRTLKPDTLAVPAPLVALIAPKASGYWRTRESAPSRTQPVFDPVTTAEASAEFTLALLFNPARLARVRQQHAINPEQIGVEKMFLELLDSTVPGDVHSGMGGELARRVGLLVVEHLLMAAYDGRQVPEVSAVAVGLLPALQRKLKRRDNDVLADTIGRARESGTFERRSGVAQMPPGSPI